MKFNFAQAILFSALTALTMSHGMPASAQKVVQPSQVACRRVISTVGGPEQPRAVSGLYNNQVPMYASPADIYGGQPTGIATIGETVFLSQPQNIEFVNDPSDQNGYGVQMIAIDTNQGQRWIPLTDMAMAAGRDGVARYTAMGKSNLGYCGVRGMW